ncbi:MAG: cyclopropane fatty-acyl-phospholipid synthase-like methyltransferase [Gammaproteobacteria bacterium]|jgi:cyclopropane fatty-acyl-phospholipid synthase-like methyltransferase
MNRPFSESCLQNSDVILNVITPYLREAKKVLEIGSGTGQHAAYFAPLFSNLSWQTSDLSENLPGIKSWIESTECQNIPEPIELDVNQDWPEISVDLIYTANTLHIMDQSSVEKCLTGLSDVLTDNGCLILYGPFNYNNQYTSDSNRRFDVWLKQNNPLSGIKDFERISELLLSSGLSIEADCEMPANNRILIFKPEL